MAANKHSTLIDLNYAVETAMDSIRGRFEEFHRKYIMDSVLVIRSELLLHPGILKSLNTETIFVQYCVDLAAALDRVSIRTLITEFVINQNSRGVSYNKQAESFSVHSGRRLLFAKYPEFERLYNLTIMHHKRSLLECIISIEQCLPDLRLASFTGTVIRISKSGSDAHRGGRTVQIVEWEDKKVVFKPTSANPARFLAEMSILLDKDHRLLGKMIPEVFAESPEGSWHAYVEQELFDDCNIKSYFEMLGSVLCLMTSIGAVDLHCENVIATQTGPKIVDVETFTSLCFSPSPNLMARDNLIRSINSGPLQTLILPIRLLGSPIPLDLSAVGSLQRSTAQTVTVFKVVNEGKDTIGFSEVSSQIKVGHRVCKKNGVIVDPRLHAKDLIRGYSAMRDRIRNNKTSIDRLIDKYAPSEVRIVLRPTMIYQQFIDASTHPFYLVDKNARRELLKKMSPCWYPKDQASRAVLVQEEIASMLDLDVPYFNITRDGSFVCGNSGNSKASFKERSVVDLIHGHFSLSASRPLCRDFNDIELALLTSPEDIWAARATEIQCDGSTPHLFPPSVVRSSGKDGVTWLEPTLLGERLVLAPLVPIFYEMGGTLIVAAIFGTEEERRDIPKILEAAHIHNSKQDRVSAMLVSGFVGATSELLSQLEVRAAGVNVPYEPISGKYIEELSSIEIEEFDYINGYGSYLAALSRYPNEDLDRDLLRSTLHSFIYNNGSALLIKNESGLAHGLAGAVCALNSAYILLEGDRVCENFIKKIIENINPMSSELLDPISSRSWCKGYPGIMYAIVEASMIVDSILLEHSIIKHAQKALMGFCKYDEPIDISLCHGLGGEVVALHQVGRVSGFSWATERALESFKVGQNAISAGTWTSGLRAAPRLNGYMLGLPGWRTARAAVQDGFVPRLLKMQE